MNALSFLERFFGWLLQTTWQAAVIVVLILLVQLIFRNRLSASWRHGLWFLLMIRLVMPTAPHSVLSIFNLIQWSQPRPTVHSPNPQFAVSLKLPASDSFINSAGSSQQSPGASQGVAEINYRANRTTFVPLPSEPKTIVQPKPSISWLSITTAIWLMGASVLFLRLVCSNLFFERRMAHGAIVSEPVVTNLLDGCRRSLGVTAQVLLVETDEVGSPAVHLLWRRRLLMPQGLREVLSTEELRHVFLHELAHLKRRDPELNWIMSVLQILHWFNPVLWFAFARMRADREMATDELAISCGAGCERSAYGETLLKVLEGITRTRVLPNLVGIGESKAQIKRRIHAIARESVARRWRWAACLLAAILAGIALTSAREDSHPADIKSKPEAANEHEPDTNCAQVVSVTPADGATEVESSQEMRIRFDRPMDPHFLKLQWLEGGFQLNGSIRVSPDRTEFTIPLRLTPGQEQRLVLNRDAEWERWEVTGKRSEMKPSRASPRKEGFLAADSAPANEFRWSFWTKSAPSKPGAIKPRIIKASPASGSTTPLLTMVELTFDQPMRSPDTLFPYLQQNRLMDGPNLIPSFEYDASSHRFTFPALLRPDDDARLTLRGFYSADGATCEPVVLHYQNDSATFTAGYRKGGNTATANPKLQALFTSMKEARARVRSGVETVQTINLFLAKTSFSSIEAQAVTFKWQGADHVYADISGPMSMKGFILGDDGQNCWLYSENEKSEQSLDTSPASLTQCNISLADPFELTEHSVSEVLLRKQWVLKDDTQLEGRRCYRVEQWDVRQDDVVDASKTETWIDAETFLPRQIVQYSPRGCEIVRFDYSQLNQPLPDSVFQPPMVPDAHPLLFAKGPAAGERRFLKINDGATGRMSGRLGWYGAKGTTSSGLN